MSIALLAIAGLVVAGTFFSIARIGKPRKTITSQDAIVTTAINAAIAVILVLAALQLH